MFKLSIFMLVLTCAAQQQTNPPKPTDEVKEKKESIDKKIEAAGTTPGAAVDPNTFQIGAEDIILVSVWHDPDFTKVHIVRPDGKITLAIVGEVQAGGLTPVALSKVIAAKLASLIKDPIVDVSVQQVNSKKYYVQGEVNRSGMFPLVVPTTVMEALSQCGGFKDFANKKNITILRKGQRLKFNFEEVSKAKKMEQNIYLESGDYIIVR